MNTSFSFCHFIFFDENLCRKGSKVTLFKNDEVDKYFKNDAQRGATFMQDEYKQRG